MRYEWDLRKNRDNFSKHGIRFEDAVKLFEYPYLTYIDDRQVYPEDRYVAIGWVDARLVALVFVEIAADVRRIISARKATRWEATRYERGY